jgi:hypothetical protein
VENFSAENTMDCLLWSCRSIFLFFCWLETIDLTRYPCPEPNGLFLCYCYQPSGVASFFLDSTSCLGRIRCVAVIGCDARLHVVSRRLIGTDPPTCLSVIAVVVLEYRIGHRLPCLQFCSVQSPTTSTRTGFTTFPTLRTLKKHNGNITNNDK